jgi:hypothetical protein
MTTYDERKAMIENEAATFPETFKLRAWGSHTFRINVRQSFVDHNGDASLVLDVMTDDGWRNFSRSSPLEIRQEMIRE